LSDEQLGNVLTNLARSEREHGEAIDQLQEGGSPDCFPTQVVTDVVESLSPDFGPTVRKTTVCLPLP
jgi:hypothetical protein